MSADPDVSEGDEYHYADGTVEIVFATDSGRVLTVTDYPDAGAFADRLHNASYKGVNEEIINLPPVEAFAPRDGDTGESGYPSERSQTEDRESEQ